MTATDLSIKMHSDAHYNSPSIFDDRLDKSFTEIDWQAPWLGHLNQLSSISKMIGSLSGSSQKLDKSIKINDQTNITAPDIIAKVLNTAMTEQNKHSQQPLQTKAAANNAPNHQGHILRFVSQDALPEGEAYESFIATTGNIPTRDNLHDLFNGSIWLTFPKTKALLNYYHMCEIAKKGISASRGRVRDTITVFDENGAILVTAEPSIGEALVDFDWQISLITSRASWDNPQKLNSGSQAAVYIFGHALLEKLLQPRKPLCAHSVVIYVSPEFFALDMLERVQYVDNQLANYMDDLLSQEVVTPRKLSPLPILGVPHFWAENADPSFYDDSQVFRSGRRQKV